MRILRSARDVFATAENKSGELIEIDGELRLRLQETLLGIYKDVKEVCDRNGITLFMIGGSALGAVRHKGFIPWDDDMDLSMSREDFRKFCGIFERELSDKYILNAPNYSKTPKNRFPRILKRDSHMKGIFDTDDEALQKIFVDLFILDNCPDNRLVRFVKGHYCNFLFMVSWIVFIYENRNEHVKRFLCSGGRINYDFRMLIGFLFSWRSACRWFERFDKAAQYDHPTRDCCLASGRKHYFGEIMRREQWFPGQIESFCGEDARIFQDKDYYLRNLYGDYMKLPPEDKREHHNVVELRFSEKTD